MSGVRFVEMNKKAEIQYLVVNHSKEPLSSLTVYVTLRAASAKQGQAPLARFMFRSPNLAGPLEGLTVWLVPAVENPPSTTFPHGVLKLAWGNVELSTDWRVGR